MGIYRNGVKNSYSEPVINLGICNIFPKIKVSPSALEFRNLSYLVGELRTDGPGTVKMRFPVVTGKIEQNRTLCFSPEDEYGDILVFTACFK